MAQKPLFLLPLLLAAAVSAQEVKEAYYWAGETLTSENTETQKLISRKAMPYVGESRNTQDVRSLCWVAPAADWVMEAKTEELELKYLEILRLVWALDESKSSGRNWSHCGLVEPTHASLTEIDQAFERHCVLSGKDRAAGYMRKANPDSKFVSRMTTKNRKITDETMIRPSTVIQKTLLALSRSEHPKTALGAIMAMQKFDAPRIFGTAAEALALNDASRTDAQRAAALDTWAIFAPTAETAKKLFRVTLNPNEPDVVRKAAMTDFSYIVYFAHGERSKLTMIPVPDPNRPDAVSDKPPVCVVRSLQDNPVVGAQAKCGYGAARSLHPQASTWTNFNDVHVDSEIKKYCDSI